MLLDRQVDLLADIAQSLRTPARVRAAERLSSVGELLRRKRYDRALAAAVRAVEDDPNNPAGFIAAGWAHIGLQAELLSPVLSDLQQALDRLGAFETEVVGRALHASQLERAVLDFADREDAWPTKLPDGTWEITKRRRFGHSTTWRASVNGRGEPVIDADGS